MTIRTYQTFKREARRSRRIARQTARDMAPSASVVRHSFDASYLSLVA